MLHLFVISTNQPCRLGYETVVQLAERNASQIIMGVRTPSKGLKAAENVYKSVPAFRGEITVYHLDMASFESVQAFANIVKAECTKVDIAILNAGISTPNWRISKDGYEETIQVNVLSTGLLALLLLPKLADGAKTSSSKPHLVIVASEGTSFPAYSG